MWTVSRQGKSLKRVLAVPAVSILVHAARYQPFQSVEDLHVETDERERFPLAEPATDRDPDQRVLLVNGELADGDLTDVLAGSPGVVGGRGPVVVVGRIGGLDRRVVRLGFDCVPGTRARTPGEQHRSQPENDD